MQENEEREFPTPTSDKLQQPGATSTATVVIAIVVAIMTTLTTQFLFEPEPKTIAGEYVEPVVQVLGLDGEREEMTVTDAVQGIINLIEINANAQRAAAAEVSANQ